MLFSVASRAVAQEAVRGLGLELLRYPAGTITQILYRDALARRLELDLRAGADIAYHGSQGVQDEEHGIAWGGGVGMRYFPQAIRRPVFVGLKLDLWRMRMDWSNHSDPSLGPNGTSRFMIVQPTAELGWDFWRVPGKFVMGATVSAGWELNALVQGAPTGQGPIALLGLSFTLL